MKRILIVLMAAVMVMAVTACAQQGTEASASAAPSEQATASVSAAVSASAQASASQDAGGQAGMANPWTQATSEDEIERAIGVDMSDPPDSATDVVFSYMESDKIGQIDFTWNGDKYTYRLQKAAGPQDISGVYVEFANVEDIVIDDDGQQAVLKYNPGAEGLVEWYKAKDSENGCLYSPTAGDASKLTMMASELE